MAAGTWGGGGYKERTLACKSTPQPPPPNTWCGVVKKTRLPFSEKGDACLNTRDHLVWKIYGGETFMSNTEWSGRKEQGLYSQDARHQLTTVPPGGTPGLYFFSCLLSWGWHRENGDRHMNQQIMMTDGQSQGGDQGIKLGRIPPSMWSVTPWPYYWRPPPCPCSVQYVECYSLTVLLKDPTVSLQCAVCGVLLPGRIIEGPHRVLAVCSMGSVTPWPYYWRTPPCPCSVQYVECYSLAVLLKAPTVSLQCAVWGVLLPDRIIEGSSVSLQCAVCGVLLPGRIIEGPHRVLAVCSMWSVTPWPYYWRTPPCPCSVQVLLKVPTVSVQYVECYSLAY